MTGDEYFVTRDRPNLSQDRQASALKGREPLTSKAHDLVLSAPRSQVESGQRCSDRERGSGGWLQKVEMLDAQNQDTGANFVCKFCKGNGHQPCTCTFRDPDETIGN